MSFIVHVGSSPTSGTNNNINNKFMTTAKNIVRLVSLWIVFILSLGAGFYSVTQLSTSVARTITNGYSSYTMPTSYNFCLQAPIYPINTQTSFSPYSSMSEQDKSSQDKYAKDMEKYNEETKKYNSEVEVLCKEDMAKQNRQELTKEKSASATDITFYATLLIATTISSVISIMSIKRSEKD